MNEHIQFDEERMALILLDQRVLPEHENFVICHTVDELIHALQTMVVRGAPAIGVAAAYGCVLALREACKTSAWRKTLAMLLMRLRKARPTAVNLAWAVARMQAEDLGEADAVLLEQTWLHLAKGIHAEDIQANKRLGAFGAVLLADGDTVMTHCNAGSLATAGYGTALGVVRAAVDAGKGITVIANETRPFLQGARLSAYELAQDGIPVSVACDNACSLLMRQGRVQAVVVGADRIAANGDVANKIGTSGVALLAKHYEIPFYVAAPSSTFDRNCPDGDAIPLETRPDKEVTHVGSARLVPQGVPVWNFAFDITDHCFVTAFITEKGVFYPPYTNSLAEVLEK